jgi:hypothetical protein
MILIFCFFFAKKKKKTKTISFKGFFKAPSEGNAVVFFDFLQKNQKKQLHFPPSPSF